MNTSECFKHIEARQQPYDPRAPKLACSPYAEQRESVFKLLLTGMPIVDTDSIHWEWQIIHHLEYRVSGKGGYPYQDEAAQAAVKWFDEHEKEEK